MRFPVHYTFINIDAEIAIFKRIHKLLVMKDMNTMRKEIITLGLMHPIFGATPSLCNIRIWKDFVCQFSKTGETGRGETVGMNKIREENLTL